MNARIVAYLAVALALTGCDGEKPKATYPKRQDRALNFSWKEKDPVVHASNTMGVAMLAELVAKEPGTNICISPISITLCASMLRNGASDKSDADLRKLLSQGSQTVVATNDRLSALMTGFEELGKADVLRLANSVWLDKGIPIKAAFTKTVKAKYKAEVDTLDFSKPEAVWKINGWVNDKTKWMIPSIIDGLEPDEFAVLVNAVALNAPWEKPLEEVGKRPFNGGAEAMFLKHKDAYGSADWDEFSWARIPYKHGLTFYAMLPKTGELSAMLSDSKACQKLADVPDDYGEGTVELPQWKSDYQLDLKAFWEPKASALFDSRISNFPKLTDVNTTWISQAVHKTHIEVDKQGTRAAAATAIGAAFGGRPSEPFHLVLDKPFVYMIVEDSTKAILFVGVVQDPTKG